MPTFGVAKRLKIDEAVLEAWGMQNSMVRRGTAVCERALLCPRFCLIRSHFQCSLCAIPITASTLLTSPTWAKCPTTRVRSKKVLNLPAIAQREETFFLGDGRTYDRQKGELLHPEHEPAQVLAELKREMGPIAFSAQYQQSPIPPGGTIIKRKWLTPYDDVKHQPGDRIS